MNNNTAIEHGINFLCDLQALFKQQIKDAYNQGYREGLQDYYLKDEFKDVSEYSNAEDYYNQKFNK